MKYHLLVELDMKEGLSAASVQATIGTWTGIPPLKVDVRGGGVSFLHYGDEKFARKLLEMHGRSIQGSAKKYKFALWNNI